MSMPNPLRNGFFSIFGRGCNALAVSAKHPSPPPRPSPLSPAIEALEARISPAVITVTGTGDTIAVDGLVTLREAITSANNNANVNSDVVASGYGTDTINFNIGGAGVHTIDVTGALPA